MDAPFASADLTFLRPLGEGGTAAVALARSKSLEREVAVKYSESTELSRIEEFRRLVGREYSLIGLSRFPGLVRILQVPSQEPDYALLEVCRGNTLDQTGPPLSVPTALNVLSALATDLEYLRACGFVHGDFKPGNVFMPENWQPDSTGRLWYAKLFDFSMGRLSTESDRERAGLGTVGFMAPETVADRETSHQSDLYALGVTAYQLLCDEHPFLHNCCDPHEINRRTRESDFIRLQDRCPELPVPIAELVESLMAQAPEGRPSSAWEVCQTLEKLGSSYPYRKALRPSHLLVPGETVDETVIRLVTNHKECRTRLRQISANRPEHLRLVLTANFIRGNLEYNDTGLVFSQRSYWPCRLRREALSTFSDLSLSEKKSAIAASIKASAGIEQSEFAASICELLPPILHPATVRRVAGRIARQGVDSLSTASLAQLNCLSGDLADAERLAYEAVHEYQGAHEYTSALRLIDRVVELADLRQEPFEVRQLLFLRGGIEKSTGAVEAALGTFRRLVAVYTDHPPDKLLAEAHKHIGDCHKLQQQPEAGQAALKEALRIFEELDDQLGRSHVLNNMGTHHFIAADYTGARKCYIRALRIQRKLKSWRDTASTLNNLAPTYFVAGRYRRAEKLFRLALAIQKELGESQEIARTLNNLGYSLSLMGDLNAAWEALEESLSLNRRTGSKKELLINLDNLTLFAIAAGRLRESLTHIKEGLAISHELKDQPHVGIFKVRMGSVFLRTGRYDRALECLEEADSVLSRLKDPVVLPTLRLHQAQLDLFIGNRIEARRKIETVMRQARADGDVYGESEALLLLSRLDANDALVNSAIELCESLHRVRDARLIRFNSLEALLELRDLDEARMVARSLLNEDLERLQDIEVPRMACLLAEVLLLDEHLETAANYLSIASARARESNLLPDLIGSLTLQGRLHYDRREFEACYARLKDGLGICREVAGTIDNEQDKRRFMQQRHVAYLVSQIKGLATRLGK